jgi:hypothetical protein
MPMALNLVDQDYFDRAPGLDYLDAQELGGQLEFPGVLAGDHVQVIGVEMFHDLLYRHPHAHKGQRPDAGSACHAVHRHFFDLSFEHDELVAVAGALQVGQGNRRVERRGDGVQARAATTQQTVRLAAYSWPILHISR